MKFARLVNYIINLGFLRSVNTGAALAQGQYHVLLNNDARLIEGSPSSALDRLEAESNCGFMGARVRHVSGGLQEAVVSSIKMAAPVVICVMSEGMICAHCFSVM